MAALAIFTFIVVGLGASLFAGHYSRTLAPTAVSFGVHIVAALLVYQLVGLGAPDAEYYDTAASSLASGGPEVSVTVGKEGWVLILAAIYSRIGHYPELGLILNATFAALTVCVAGLTASRLNMPVRATAWITAVFPSGIIWSSFLLRESISWLLTGLFFLAFAGLARGKVRWLDLALALTALVLQSRLWGVAAGFVMALLGAALVFSSPEGAADHVAGV